MNRSLSWKILIPLGIIMFIVGKIIGEFIGSALNILAIIILLMGAIDAIRIVLKKDKSKVL
jgi:hypothetical protein